MDNKTSYHTFGSPSADDDNDDVDALAFHLDVVRDEKKDGLVCGGSDDVVGIFPDLVKCVSSVCFFKSGSITLWHFSFVLGFRFDLLFPLKTSPILNTEQSHYNNNNFICALL